MRRVLERRIARWARRAGPGEHAASDAARARQAAAAVVARLVGAGAIDDAAFSAARARTLRRAGRSARAIAAHLAARGAPAPAGAPDPDQELAAAALHARKRRLGPFARTPASDPAARRRIAASFARAGFSAEITRRALALSAEEADALIAALKRG